MEKKYYVAIMVPDEIDGNLPQPGLAGPYTMTDAKAAIMEYVDTEYEEFLESNMDDPDYPWVKFCDRDSGIPLVMAVVPIFSQIADAWQAVKT